MVRFGEFEFDRQTQRLSRNGKPCHLRGREAALLDFLLEHRGRIVTRDEIVRHLWPGENGSDATVNQHLYTLRKKIGDDGPPFRFIDTIFAKGYRFVAERSGGGEPAPQPLAAQAPDSLDIDRFASFRLLNRGNHLLEKRTGDALEKAVETFTEALSITPDYVPALLGLARAYGLLGDYYRAPLQTFPRALEAVERAIAVEPASPDARALKGALLVFARRDWHQAASLIESARRLAPDSPIVRRYATLYDLCAGELDRALVEARRLQEIELGSTMAITLLGTVLMHRGELAKALGCFTNALDADPEFELGHHHRALTLLLAGEPQRAMWDLATAALEHAPQSRAVLARAYADLGDTVRATTMADALERRAQTEYVSSFHLALAWVGTPQRERALRHLQAAADAAEPALLLYPTGALFESLRAETAYANAIRRGPV